MESAGFLSTTRLNYRTGWRRPGSTVECSEWKWRGAAVLWVCWHRCMYKRSGGRLGCPVQWHPHHHGKALRWFSPQRTYMTRTCLDFISTVCYFTCFIFHINNNNYSKYNQPNKRITFTYDQTFRKNISTDRPKTKFNLTWLLMDIGPIFSSIN